MALVVLLRGVNVGGHRRFRPAALARELATWDVVNVGAAGTFVVRRPVAQARLRAALARRLPFPAEILICRGSELVRLLERDWFAGQRQGPDRVRFVGVLAKTPRAAPAVPLDLPPAGRWRVRILGREGRLLVGVHRRELSVLRWLGALDRVFGAPATIRSWKTLEAVAGVLAAGGSRRAGSERLR